MTPETHRNSIVCDRKRRILPGTTAQLQCQEVAQRKPSNGSSPSSKYWVASSPASPNGAKSTTNGRRFLLPYKPSSVTSTTCRIGSDVRSWRKTASDYARGVTSFDVNSKPSSNGSGSNSSPTSPLPTRRVFGQQWRNWTRRKQSTSPRWRSEATSIANQNSSSKASRSTSQSVTHRQDSTQQTQLWRNRRGCGNCLVKLTVTMCNSSQPSLISISTGKKWAS